MRTRATERVSESGGIHGGCEAGRSHVRPGVPLRRERDVDVFFILDLRVVCERGGELWHVRHGWVTTAPGWVTTTRHLSDLPETPTDSRSQPFVGPTGMCALMETTPRTAPSARRAFTHRSLTHCPTAAPEAPLL